MLIKVDGGSWPKRQQKIRPVLRLALGPIAKGSRSFAGWLHGSCKGVYRLRTCVGTYVPLAPVINRIMSYQGLISHLAP